MLLKTVFSFPFCFIFLYHDLLHVHVRRRTSRAVEPHQIAFSVPGVIN